MNTQQIIETLQEIALTGKYDRDRVQASAVLLDYEKYTQELGDKEEVTQNIYDMLAKLDVVETD
jgi:hypothetical protein